MRIFFSKKIAAARRRLTLAGALSLAIISMTTAVYAGPGHDHGDEKATATGGMIWPRFAATSEIFELVGIVQGKQLLLFLDYAQSNAPVKGATLELEFGGVKLKVESGSEGEFTATLPQAPKAGITSITATVIAGKDSDLLAGELDIHEASDSAPGTLRQHGMKWLSWGLGTTLVFFCAWALWRRLHRKPTRFGGRAGGAA